MPNSLSDLICTVLPGKWGHDRSIPQLYDRVYGYWRQTWAEVFLRAGSPESLTVENFFRHQQLICLHRENEIAGLLASTWFNLEARATFDHPFVQAYPSDLLNSLQSRGRGIVITGEYLSVHPAYRSSIVGMPLSEVLVGVLSKIMREVGACMILGTPIRETRVKQSLAKFGFKETDGLVRKCGIECVPMYVSTEMLVPHPDREIDSAISEIWGTTRDWTGLVFPKSVETSRRIA